jgi:hypothetical protein
MVWTKLVATLNVCGVLLAVPAGAAGLYTTYLPSFSSEGTCRALRSSILSTLEKDVNATVKQALLRKDVAEFEQSCALGDPEAKALITAISNNDLVAKRDGKAESRPVLSASANAVPLPALAEQAGHGAGFIAARLWGADRHLRSMEGLQDLRHAVFLRRRSPTNATSLWVKRRKARSEHLLSGLPR